MDYSIVKFGKDGVVSNVDEIVKAGLVGSKGFPNPVKIKFSHWTKEWKEAYYSYRGYGNRGGNENQKKKRDEVESLFNQLLVHLEKDKVGRDLVESLKSNVLSQKGGSETYLTGIFGTEQPKEGLTVTFLMVSVRTAEGGRFISHEKALESLGSGVGTLKYDDKKIFSMIEKIKERGYKLDVDSVKRTITFNGK